MSNITQDGTQFSFGGLVLEVNGNDVIFQDISISEGTNIVDLEGSDGSIISQVFVSRPKEASGTAVVENNKPLLKRGDQFSFKIHGTDTSDTTFLITDTSTQKSGGSFSTQTFSARERLN